MPYTTAFKTGRDKVRSLRYEVVSTQVLDGDIGEVTLAVDHGLVVGDVVTISGTTGHLESSTQLPAFDITATVEAVGTSTFQVALHATGFLTDDAPVSTTGLVHFPANEAYIRWPTGADQQRDLQTILDNEKLANSGLFFYAEAWSYDTVRLTWGLPDALIALLNQDLDRGIIPEVTMVRSSYGFPNTVHEGDAVMQLPYELAVGNSIDPWLGRAVPVDPGPPPRSVAPRYKSPFFRPDSISPAVYDRYLPSGRWYYYTLFLQLGLQLEDDSWSSHWVPVATTKALVPVDYNHRGVLYDQLPPYYQARDREFVEGTIQPKGLIERLIATIGFELDLTRTLGEALDGIYDADRLEHNLLEQLGTTNLGLHLEKGLGSVNYRSLLSGILRLYGGRGNAGTVNQVAQLATKYSTNLVEGMNLLLLTDDSEFVDGTGSWGAPYDFIADQFPVTDTITPSIASVQGPEAVRSEKRRQMTFSAEGSYADEDGVVYVDEHGSPYIDASLYDPTKGLVVCCGAGEGFTLNRFHDPEPTKFVPYYNGVRVKPGAKYTFSFYMYRDESTPIDEGTDGFGAADVYPGIMWFGPPSNPTAPDSFKASDFLSESHDDPLVEEGGVDPIPRYSVTAVAPDSQPLVYAVPYIAVSNSGALRYVSCAMLNLFPNTDTDFVPPSFDIFIILGVSPQGDLDGDYVLGTP